MKIFGQLEKAQLENLTADPTGTGLVPGVVWYRTDQKLFKVYDGTVVQSFVDLDTAQTLSNKILASPELTGAITFNQTTTPTTPAAGKNKFYYKTDGLLYTLDSAGNEALVGSGAEGGGATNLISNGSAESTAVSIFTPYADAAGTRPVDGIGGSPTVTTAINSSNVLVKNKDFTLIKPATNCQGQGWAISNIALPLAYRGKSVKSFLDYLVNSGTFVPGTTGGTPTDGDIIVYFYDQTNSKLMEPSNIKFLGSSTTISDRYESTIQFDTNCTQVRMIIHVASTSALAWTLQVDNITLSPSVYVYGTPVTDFQSYTPTFTNLGSVSSVNLFFKREGDSIRIQGSLITGTVAAARPTMTLPSGFSINSGIGGTSGSYGYVSRIPANSASQLTISYSTATIVNLGFENANINYNPSESIQINAIIPIQGLSSSVQMSDGYDGRVVSAATSVLVGGQSIPINVPTKIQLTNINFDKIGMWDSINNRFIIKTAGDYLVHGAIATTSPAVAYQHDARIFVNGNLIKLAGGQRSGATSGFAYNPYSFLLQDLKVNDYVELFHAQSSGSAVLIRGNDTAPDITCFNIQKLQGPQTISASEKFISKYRFTTAKTASPTAPFDFNTKVTDLQGSVTTGVAWKFTSRTAASYIVNVKHAAAGTSVTTYLYKNGVQADDFFTSAFTANNGTMNGTVQVDLLDGEYIDIRLDATVSVNNGTISIWRI